MADPYARVRVAERNATNLRLIRELQRDKAVLLSRVQDRDAEIERLRADLQAMRDKWDASVAEAAASLAEEAGQEPQVERCFHCGEVEHGYCEPEREAGHRG